MKQMMRALASVGGTITIILATTTAASAVNSKAGTVSCSRLQACSVAVSSAGKASVYQQGIGTPLASRTSTLRLDWKYVSPVNGGTLNWAVSGDTVWLDATYGFCTNTGVG